MKFLKQNNDLAITAKDNKITYRDFYTKIKKYGEQLKDQGITPKDRVLIVGDPNQMIETIAWAYATSFIGASPANASIKQSQEEINLKSKSANVKAHVWCDGTIKIVSDKSSKQHPAENFVYFSSNTTIKNENLYTTEPGFFYYPKDWKTGFASEDTLKLFQSKLGKVPLSQLSAMGWEIAYAPHNVSVMLMSGGTYHYVGHESEFAVAQKKYKTNCISTYPISIERMCQNKIEPPIDFVEVSGGPFAPTLVNKIREQINPKYISNSFGTVAGGLLLTKIIEPNDVAETIQYMNTYEETGLQTKLDANGVLFFSRNNSTWIDDGDVFELVDGSYKFKTRTHDEHLNFKGGKISTWEIEGYANDLLKTVKGCGDHTYVFPMKGLDGHHRHGLIYSGSVPVNDVKERLSGLISYKRPNAIYRVSDDFWATDIKVSRGRMAEKIDQQRKYIIEQC